MFTCNIHKKNLHSTCDVLELVYVDDWHESNRSVVREYDTLCTNNKIVDFCQVDISISTKTHDIVHSRFFNETNTSDSLYFFLPEKYKTTVFVNYFGVFGTDLDEDRCAVDYDMLFNDTVNKIKK